MPAPPTPIAVFYHAKIAGEGIPNEDHALFVLASQLNALKQSGLSDSAAELHIGVNGNDSQALLIGALAPPKSKFCVHGAGARTEIPTLNLIRQWLPDHPGWHVLYHHTKGVTHPGNEGYEKWRFRMENACVWNWKRCVSDLQRGRDAVGCHWLTPERYPGTVTSPFFGGTFWWSTSSYLSQLPALPPPTWENRFEAESWIGRRRPYPKVMDYYPGWP